MRTYIIDSETESSDQNQGIRLGLVILRTFDGSHAIQETRSRI